MLHNHLDIWYDGRKNRNNKISVRFDICDLEQLDNLTIDYFHDGTSHAGNSVDKYPLRHFQKVIEEKIPFEKVDQSGLKLWSPGQGT